MKFLSAAGTAFVAFLALFFALAITETVTGLFINPFGSRGMLFLLMVALAVAVGVYRGRGRSARERPPQAGSLARPAKSSPVVDPQMAADLLARLDRIAAAARAEKTEMAFRSPQQPGPATASATPAPPAERDDLVDAASRQAILFHQYFPPPHDERISSFFGGAPIAPSGFEWPRSPSKSGPDKPLHFVMQVDCSAVPAAARLGALPDSGVLYFFLNLEWGEDGGHAVIYQPPTDAKLASVPPPNDLGPVFGEEAAFSWAWAQTMEQCPVLLPKWPFEPIAIAVPAFVPEDEEAEEYPALWPEKAVEDSIVAAGDVAESNYFTIRDFIAGEALQRPFPSFPHDWRAVQICSAQLVERVAKARRYPEARLFADLDPEAKDAHLAAIGAEAQAWFDRAAAQPAFDAVAHADSDSFWEFLAANSRLSMHVLGDALIASIEASLTGSAEAAARVPSEIADRIRSRHALAVRTERGFHVNIPDRMLAPPVDVQGNQWDRAKTHLLLLEISSNEGLGHRFGEGVYQFWIAPEDLRAGRFDRAELTSDAY